MKNNILVPYTLTILPTYKCTSACPTCSLECSPLLNSPTISLKSIKKYITEAKTTFKSLELVVFTGGECFILGNQLLDAIKHASNLGLKVRCVTNGYWAKTKKGTEKKINELLAAGLNELNFSTGDEHNVFVPVENIIIAAIIAAKNNIRTAIAIEGHDNSKININSLFKNKYIKEFYKKYPDKKMNLMILQNIWVSIHNNKEFVQKEIYNQITPEKAQEQGCKNLFYNIGINPEEQFVSCCGLTFENIPEMKLGSLKEFSMKELFEKQLDDFLKIWNFIEGPVEIIKYLADKNSKIELPQINYHPCEACTYMYKNKIIREALLKYYNEKMDDIFFKLSLRSLPI